MLVSLHKKFSVKFSSTKTLKGKSASYWTQNKSNWKIRRPTKSDLMLKAWHFLSDSYSSLIKDFGCQGNVKHERRRWEDRLTALRYFTLYDIMTSLYWHYIDIVWHCMTSQAVLPYTWHWHHLYLPDAGSWSGENRVRYIVHGTIAEHQKMICSPWVEPQRHWEGLILQIKWNHATSQF